MRVPHPTTAVLSEGILSAAIVAESSQTPANDFADHLAHPLDRTAFADIRKKTSGREPFGAPRPDHSDDGASPLDGSIAGECPVANAGDSLRLPFVPAPRELLPEVRSAQQRRIDRKLSLIRRSGLFGADTKGARISRAATREDLRDAYKLVHRVYLGTGYISEEQAEMRLRIFETSTDTATFVAKKDGQVVGVLSIVQDSEEFGLPSDEAFSEELRSLRETGLKLGEITNQAVDEKFRCSAVPTELMRCALAHGIEAGFDVGIAALSPSHNAFYELLGFRQIGGRRSYSGKIHDPVVPLQIDLEEHRNPRRQFDAVEEFMHSFLTAENPYFLYVKSWENVARERFRDPNLLRGLFIEERNFIGECTKEMRDALHQHWGEDLFAQVTGSLFLPPLGPIAPDLRELDAPRPGTFSLPPRESATPLAHDVEAALAREHCIEDLGLSDRDVQMWKSGLRGGTHAFVPDSERQSSRPAQFRWEAPARTLGVLRNFVSGFWRHSAVHAPREAN